jgi:hypothetical protein
MNNTITQAEISKWWEIFSQLNPVNGLLNGVQAAPVLKNSQLGDGKLERVWDLADVDSDGSLDFEEFCVAMKLIFDLINGVYEDVPATLPDFLVPSSKAHLVQAGRDVAAGPAAFEREEEDLESPSAAKPFEWYISPVDREKYVTVYESGADRHGNLAFDMLEDFFQTIDCQDTDLRSAWNLVNPQADETIGRDQAVVFLHILRQRQDGAEMPRSVPASLRSSFQNERPSYNVSEPSKPRPSPATKKGGFGDAYLSRLGVNSSKAKGTDFSSSKDTDWEEVRLRKQLADLKDQYERIQRQQQNEKELGKSTTAALVRKELERLLDYKRSELRKLENGSYSNGSAMKRFQDEFSVVQDQLEALRAHMREREQELSRIKSQIAEAG